MTDVTDTSNDSALDVARTGGDVVAAPSAVALDAGRDEADLATADTTRALVGRGLSFPFSIDGTGAVALSEGDDVAAAVRMIIMTAPGERPMRHEFGCAIWDHVYSPVNASTLGQMAHAVRRALARWEPRIEVDRVVVRPDVAADPHVDSRVTIEVDYRLRSSNDRRNLVYPFYVIPEGGH